MNAKTTNSDNSLEDYLMILTEIRELRSEFKEELLRLNDTLTHKIAGILEQQSEQLRNYNDQTLAIKEMEHRLGIRMVEMEVRINTLEQFKYLLLLAVFLGCILGSSVVSYLPSILKVLV